MAQLIELGCLKKLVAQSYDGAAVMSDELNGVQAKVKESAPEAIFIHCFAHMSILVLIQATSSISKLKYFSQLQEAYPHFLLPLQNEQLYKTIW